jgi:hypothetical protein
MLKIGMIIWGLLVGANARAQLVNIEARRIHNDSVRRAGEINADLNFTDVNGRRLTVFNSALVLQQKSRNLRSYWLLLGNAAFSKLRNQDIENTFFLHLRFNHKLGKKLRWEAFTQIQGNLPIGIRQRYLTGTGPRIKLLDRQHLHLFVGSLYMLEFERASNGINTFAHRNSSYLSLSLDIPAIKAELISTTYYQPLFANFADFRVLTENRLDFHITKNFKVQTSFRYFYDSRPPQGFKNYTTNFRQGFGWKF